jgi:Uma2 family endonuclease
MTQQREKLMTAEEFWKRHSNVKLPRYELVKGELVEMSPPGGVHGEVSLAIGAALRLHVRQNNLGRVMVESGYYLERDPDTVRGPDVSFIRAERVAAEGLPRSWVRGAPDVAVEVVSPSDSAAEVEGKVHDYLAGGAQRVWVVYSDIKRITVYSSDGTVLRYHEGDTLEDQDLLPGFSLLVAEVFAS